MGKIPILEKPYKGEIQVKAIMSKMKNSEEEQANIGCNGIQLRLRLLLQIPPLLDMKALCFDYVLLQCKNAEKTPIQVTQVIQMGFTDLQQNDH